MNEEVKNEIENVDNSKSTKPKRIMKGCLLAGLVLILAVVGIYSLIFNNPKNIFLQSINNEYKKFDKLLDDSIESMIGLSKDTSMKTNMTLDFDIKASEEMLDENTAALLDEINKLNATLNAQIDAKGKQFSYGLEAKYDNNSLLNVAAYGSNEKIYLELKNIFDKYIEIPVEDYDALFETGEESIEDARYILETMKDSVLKNMEKKDFTTSKEEIMLGSEKVKTKKITYTLTEEVAYTLANNVLNDLNKNDKFLKAYANITGEEQSDVKDMFKDAVQDLKENKPEEFDTTTKFEFSVYTKGLLNETVEYEIRMDSDEDVAITYSNYKNVKRIVFKENSANLISIVNEKGKDSNYITTVVIDSIKFVINSKEENDTWTHTYKATMPDSDVELRGKVVTTTKEVTKDKEYTSSISFTFGMGMKDSEDLVSIGFTANGSSKVGEEVVIPNVENSVLVTSLTEEDMNTIMTNIMNNETLMNFITRITALTETNDTYDDSYDYDYDYDDSQDYEW